LNFFSPCTDPEVFNSKPQSNPSPYAYTGNNLLIGITPFSITPADCKINYTLESVVLDGATPGLDTPIPLSAFVYNEATKKFTFNADSSKYTDSVNPYPPGDYILTIRGTVDLAPSFTETETITLTIPDLCDPPLSITPSLVTNQVYTISDTPYTYTVSPFSVIPTFCEVDYSTTKTNLADSTSAVAIQESQLSFDIDYISSLVPAINNEKQTMTIVATSKTKYSAAPSSQKTASASFDLRFLNPCIDTNFVAIAGPADMPNYFYTPETSTVVLYPSVSAFTVTTTPRTHSLCGGLSYTATFDGSPVDGDPLAFSAATRTFTADSDDTSLVDTSKTYAVRAEFTNWPVGTYSGAPSAMKTGTIDFGDACDSASPTVTS